MAKPWSARQRRILDRYWALQRSALTLRSLQQLDDDCWVHETPGIYAAAQAIMEALEAKADRLEERYPWVIDAAEEARRG